MTDTSPAPLLKDILGPSALATIAEAGAHATPRFDRPMFLAAAADGLAALSIMERVRHIADALHAAVPADYPATLDILRAMAPRLTHAFQAVAVAEVVARHGLHDPERSLAALADLTRYGTAEFAIRPFLAQQPAQTLATMQRWTASADPHVRRLASEGSRPRLPWAARVPALKDDPTRAAPILEALKNDDSPYVRKSVANHLNDIARERPDWLLDRLGGWARGAPATDWIVRHALRTLIKQGDPRALALIGVTHGAAVAVRGFCVSPQHIHLGDTLTVAVDLASTSPDTQRLVVDYRVHYARPGGRTVAKVFKLRTFDLAGHADATFAIRQPIRDFSTRRHHPGAHAVDLIVNGRTMATSTFDLAVWRERDSSTSPRT